jgi:hypothetical protein
MLGTTWFHWFNGDLNRFKALLNDISKILSLVI